MGERFKFLQGLGDLRGGTTTPLFVPQKIIVLHVISNWKFTCTKISLWDFTCNQFFNHTCIETSYTDVNDVMGNKCVEIDGICVNQLLLDQISQNFIYSIAIVWLEALQSFEMIPTFLTEIWRHQVLTSRQKFYDVITPSFQVILTPNFTKSFLFMS